MVSIGEAERMRSEHHVSVCYDISESRTRQEILLGSDAAWLLLLPALPTQRLPVAAARERSEALSWS